MTPLMEATKAHQAANAKLNTAQMLLAIAHEVLEDAEDRVDSTHNSLTIEYAKDSAMRGLTNGLSR